MTIDNSSTTTADSLALCTATEMTTLRPALGEAGSYAHNQHQLNYRLCEDADTLYQITGEKRYPCIKRTLTAERRNHIETQSLRPVVVMSTQTYDHDFGTIHNHGLWSVAAVGTCGLVIGDDSYVTLAVDGCKATGQVAVSWPRSASCLRPRVTTSKALATTA